MVDPTMSDSPELVLIKCGTCGRLFPDEDAIRAHQDTDTLDIIDRAIERAHAEVERLQRKAETNADRPRQAMCSVALYSDHVADQVALHAALAAESALRGVWADVARAQRNRGES